MKNTDVLNKLPAVAYVDNGQDQSPGAAPVIAVKRGEMGYYPIFTSRTADELNALEGVTPAQREAMYMGSMFGWDIPGADPDVQAAAMVKHERAAS